MARQPKPPQPPHPPPPTSRPPGALTTSSSSSTSFQALHRTASAPIHASPQAAPPLPPLAPLAPVSRRTAAVAAAAAYNVDRHVRSSNNNFNTSSGSEEEKSSSSSSSLPRPSLLQPRLAVVLNVPPPWHPWLFALRLSSVLPALWWGLPSALRVALRLLPGGDVVQEGSVYASAETMLATLWCFASGYLSFFFTDCLMSRWLINYTPQATIVRLITINALNAYITSIVLSLTGGFDDPRLLLPGWIVLATTLTGCYHITHQKINIRKETSTSINVFSIASYVTMLTLLVYLHRYQPQYPEIPLVTKGRSLWLKANHLFAQFKVAIERAEL